LDHGKDWNMTIDLLNEAAQALDEVIAEKAKAKPTARRYQEVNATWPESLPTMTGVEAIRAAKRLYRRTMGKAWPGTWKAGRGNHRTYPRGSVFLVNPGQGWHDMVHDLSHYCHRKLYPTHRPHAHSHAEVERDMIRHVLEGGWLDGRLRPQPKAKPPVADVRYARVLARITSWERKAKRAENALKKLRRQRAYYERKGAR
jgi:hypothetical protein